MKLHFTTSQIIEWYDVNEIIPDLWYEEGDETGYWVSDIVLVKCVDGDYVNAFYEIDSDDINVEGGWVDSISGMWIDNHDVAYWTYDI